MPELQEIHGGWWAQFDSWADTVAIWVALLCVVVFIVHIRTHPRGFRDRRVVGACLAGVVVSILYRWSS